MKPDGLFMAVVIGLGLYFALYGWWPEIRGWLKSLVHELKPGEVPPKFYGPAWREWPSARLFFMPVPLNWIVAVARVTYARMVYGTRPWVDHPTLAYRKGYTDGFEQARRKVQTWIDGVDGVSITDRIELDFKLSDEEQQLWMHHF